MDYSGKKPYRDAFFVTGGLYRIIVFSRIQIHDGYVVFVSLDYKLFSDQTAY